MLLLWFFIAGCEETKTEIELLAERCMPILMRIDEKQKLRHDKMDQQQQLTEQRQLEKIDATEFSRLLLIWLKEEEQLRKEVNKLLNTAEEQGCL